jgi:peptidoglycan/LPS O-acetylase OafA/YrhL
MAVQQLVILITPDLPIVASTLVALVVALGFAVASRHFIEKQAHRFKTSRPSAVEALVKHDD